MAPPPRSSRAIVAALITTALLLGLGGTSLGQTISPAITPASMRVESPVARGQDIALDRLVVRNRGTDRLEMLMGASGDPEASRWVEFRPASFTVGPEGNQVVEAYLHVPSNAPEREYTVRMAARTPTDAGGDGIAIAVTAGVASTLRFEVSEQAAAGGHPGGFHYWWVGLLALPAGAASYWLTSLIGRVEFQSPVRRKH